MSQYITVYISVCNPAIGELSRAVSSAISLKSVVGEIILVNDGKSNDVHYMLPVLSNRCSNQGIKLVHIGFDEDKIPSGSDALASNIAIANASYQYVCKLDQDDTLVYLPEEFTGDIWLAGINTRYPHMPTIRKLITAPRAVINGMVCKKDILIRFPFVEGIEFHTDVCFILTCLYVNDYDIEVSDKLSYIRSEKKGSLTYDNPTITREIKRMFTLAAFAKQADIDYDDWRIYTTLIANPIVPLNEMR